MTKKNEDFDFIHRGDFDVSKILNYLKEYDSEWLSDTSRQNTYQAHKETNSIFIYDYSADWKIGEPYSIQQKTDSKELIELVDPLIKYLEKIHDGRVAKTVFIKLPPAKNVHKHVDFGDYLESIRRHHVAIATNKDVAFIINGKKKNMSVGEIWEVNNNKEHQVWNDGSTDRIHLMIDIIPNKFL